jgi:RNA polymerase sigma-70 factor (ECF subfamily)
MPASEVYSQNVVRLQTQLFAYILTLLVDRTAADDVLQETNLVLWRKADEFHEGADFKSWAFSIARFQCLAYWKTKSHDRLVLDERVLEAVADRSEHRLADISDRVQALRQCLEELTDRQRTLLEGRYGPDGSVKRLAAHLGRPEASISQALWRIRNMLTACISARLTQAQGASK